MTAFRFSSERVKLNCVTLSVNYGYLYLKKLSMNRKKRVWDKPYIYCVELRFIDIVPWDVRSSKSGKHDIENYDLEKFGFKSRAYASPELDGTSCTEERTSLLSCYTRLKYVDR